MAAGVAGACTITLNRSNSIAGLANQVAEGSIPLFLANMIGIMVTSMMVFMLQGYGSLHNARHHLLVRLSFP